MRSLMYAAAVGALFVGTSAQAAVPISITGVQAGVITLNDEVNGGTVVGPNNMWGNTDVQPGVTSGGSVETIVKIKPTYASFESGVAVSGPGASASSSSGLNATITNMTEGAIQIGAVGSTIIPAGLGFYMQDRTVNPVLPNPFTGYGQADYASFGDLFTQDLAGTTFATAGFTFDIYGDGYLTNVNAAVPLYTLSGLLTLSFDDVGNVIRGGNIETAGLSLGNFATEFDTDFALAYNWGQKDIDVILNKVLQVGDYTNLYYRTTAFASTNTNCLTGTDDEDEVFATSCLVAYSGFGDPIGRGGGVSLMSFMAESIVEDHIDYLKFDPQRIDPFRVTSTPYTGGAVPEPGTWALMILGFGFAGAALRRRRLLSYS